MNDKLFEDLIASVREGSAILRGETQPARAFEITAPAAETPDGRHIRDDYQLSQVEFAVRAAQLCTPKAKSRSR